MRRITNSLVAVGAVAVSAVVSTASPALATSGAQARLAFTFSGTAASWILNDVSLSHQVTCAASHINGTNDGGGRPLTVTAKTVSGCFIGPPTITTIASFLSYPWSFKWTSVLGLVWTGTLNGVRFHIANPLCSADLAGPGGSTSTSGFVTAVYNSSVWHLTLSGGNLKFYNVSGCLGLFVTGDPATVTASYS